MKETNIHCRGDRRWPN